MSALGTEYPPAAFQLQLKLKFQLKFHLKLKLQLELKFVVAVAVEVRGYLVLAKQWVLWRRRFGGFAL